jgi:hypothetical protein
VYRVKLTIQKRWLRIRREFCKSFSNFSDFRTNLEDFDVILLVLNSWFCVTVTVLPLDEFVTDRFSVGINSAIMNSTKTQLAQIWLLVVLDYLSKLLLNVIFYLLLAVTFTRFCFRFRIFSTSYFKHFIFCALDKTCGSDVIQFYFCFSFNFQNLLA